MEEGRGKLTITVKNALQLPVVKHHPSLLKKLAPKMNPYVVFKLGSESQQTRTDDGGHRAPVWNEKITFDIMPGLGDLDVRVMHKGSLTGKDTEIAYGSIPSHMLRQFRGRDHRINVTGPGDSGPSGSISISAIFEPEQEVLRQELLTAQQFNKYRSSSVESGSSRHALQTQHSSQGSMGHANSQRMSYEAPGWLSGVRQQSSSLQPSQVASPRQGQEGELAVPSTKSKKGWRLGHLIGYHKKEYSSEDKPGQSPLSSNESGLQNRISGIEGQPSTPYTPESGEDGDEFAQAAESPPQYEEQVGRPIARAESPLKGGLDSGQLGRHNNPNFASPERGPPASQRQSGMQLQSAEEGPFGRTKTKWLDDWEGRHLSPNRRVTESSLPSHPDPTFSQAPNSHRRQTETYERPSAPLMEAPQLATTGDRNNPQHAHLKTGREVREWHEFNGPAPPNYKLPQYLGAIVDQDNADVRWDMSARNNRKQTTQRERETQWQRQNSDLPSERHQSSGGEAHPIQEAMEAMRVSRKAAHNSMAEPEGSQRLGPQSEAELLRYPEPAYDGTAMSSLSDRFGGFSQPTDRPIFSDLPLQGNQQLPGQASPPVTARNNHQGNDMMSLPPMYPSPFGQSLATTTTGQGFSREHSIYPANTQNNQSQAGGTVPFADIKDRLEERDSGGSSLRQKDLSQAVASLQTEIASDDWRLDESELAIAVDAKGNPARLGKGAFGEVYKGTLYRHPVAIKVLEVDSQKTLKDALDEMKVLGHLRSTCIVQFLGYTFTEEVDPLSNSKMIKKVNLVTELMEGNLWEALGRGQFLWYDGGSKIVKQVCTGLYLLHVKKTMHLDLKSPNILLGNNQAKIADFGMASVVGMNNIRGTIKGMGTYAWASPEMLLGTRPVTDKADVFSLGVILWEICTGERPQRGVLRALAADEAPEEIDKLIQQSILEDADERPTALEFLQILEKFVPAD